MLLVLSSLNGYAIQASDGKLGTVSDFLFDDATWKLRWLVVDTGNWLPGRKVLIHPSAIGVADFEREELAVNLTKKQIEDSPDILSDLPVSRQMEYNLYDHYAWDPLWGGPGYFGGAIASPLSAPPYFGLTGPGEATLAEAAGTDGDPHLRSIADVTGAHIHASDGAIGHLENFLVDNADWTIRYLIVDTRNWWAGQHVLVSPYAVRDISWAEHEIHLTVTREKVKTSPPWTPFDKVDEAYERQLHQHYDWPGYGW